MGDDEYRDILDRADALEEDEEADRGERGAHRPPSDDPGDGSEETQATSGSDTARGKLEEIEAQLEVIADAVGISLHRGTRRGRE